MNAHKLTSPPLGDHKAAEIIAENTQKQEVTNAPISPEPLKPVVSPSRDILPAVEKPAASLSPTRPSAEAISNNALLAAKAHVTPITHQAAALEMHSGTSSPTKRSQDNGIIENKNITPKANDEDANRARSPAKRTIDEDGSRSTQPVKYATDNESASSNPPKKQLANLHPSTPSVSAKQPREAPAVKQPESSRIDIDYLKPFQPASTVSQNIAPASNKENNITQPIRPTSPVKQYDDSNLLKQIERLKEHASEISKVTQTAIVAESAKVVAEIHKSSASITSLENKLVTSTKSQFQLLDAQVRSLSKQSEQNLEHINSRIMESSSQAMLTELQQSVVQMHTLMQQMQKDLVTHMPSMSEEHTLHRSPQENMDVTVDMGDIESIESENEIQLDPPQITMLENQLKLATQGNLRLVAEVQSHKLEHDRMEQEMNAYKMTIQTLNTEKQSLSQQIKILKQQSAQQITDFAARNQRVKDLKKQNTTMAQMLLSIAK